MAPHLRLATRSDIAASQPQIAWLRRHQAYMEHITTNAAPYVSYIYEQTRRRGMPAELALLPMIESAYNPFVYSRAGATGLWQMMPGTASGFGLQIDWWYDGRRDIVASTAAALNYLSYLHALFHDWLLAIAAYNSGEGTVQAAIRHNQQLHKSTRFWALPLPIETRAYVPQLLAMAAVIKNPGHYGISLVDVPHRQMFAAVPMKQSLDIKEAAKLAHVETTVIRQLNPGFRRSSTTPNRNYDLLLPTESIELFKLELSRSPKINSTSKTNNHRLTPVEANIAADRVPGPQQTIHTVSRWDSLSKIARRYGVSVRQIQFWNNLGRNESPRTNQKLVLWLRHSYHAATGRFQAGRYQVQSGDSLSAIARRYHISVSALQSANQLKGSAIRQHQWLVIPGSHSTTQKSIQASTRNPSLSSPKIITVSAGQTLYSIARQHRVSTQQLLNWNHLRANATLHVGQRLVVH